MFYRKRDWDWGGEKAMDLKGFGWSVNLGHEGDEGNREKKEESVRNPAYIE